MKRFLSLILGLIMVFSMVSPIPASAQTEDAVTDLVSSMSLRDKVTQMLMVDFRKWGETRSSATDFTVMNEEVRKIVEDYNFGAVIYFANNIQETEQSYNLSQEFQAAATKDGGIPLIISADQEGGSVYRLGSGTALPGNMALGATYTSNGTKYAYEAGKIIGSELSVLGINTALAPVVDVNNNPNNPVIGLRSYSDDASIVGELASAVIAGMAEYNVIGCAKHFPGHGDTSTDSHYGLPIVDKPLSVLLENELKPYQVAIDQNIEMIMTAHILYPQLENDTIVSNKTGEAESLPATMSDDIITGLLKEEMGFEGIVCTDAMNMAGISSNWDQIQSIIIAINAGIDMICMPCTLYCQDDLANLDTIIENVVATVETGAIPMARIDDAVTRILTVKKNRGILDYNAADYSLETALNVVGCDANRDMERELSAAAVTVVKNEDNTLPLSLTSESKVLMLVPYNNELAQMIIAWNRAREACLIPEGAEVKAVRFSSSTTIESIQSDLDWADTYIINSEISSTARMEYKHWLSSLPNEFCNYAAENGKTAIISSVDKPYDVQLYPNADAIVAAYGCKGSSVDPTEAIVGGITGSENAFGPNIVAAVEVILGTFCAQGKLPVDVPVYDVDSNSYTNTILYPRGTGLTYEAKTAAYHIWGEWETTIPATGAAEGLKERSCSVCGALETESIPTLDIPFEDMEPGAFYESAVLWAVEQGITTGVDDIHFAPDDICTRSRIVTFLWRSNGCPAPEFRMNPFTDVPGDQWFTDAVLWAVEKGITTGTTKETFSPDDPCTRAQVATFLWRAAGFPEPASTANPFTDVPEDEWYTLPILWAVEEGITNGYGSNDIFAPELNCTRGQIVTFLFRAMNE